jgi:carbon storage regulator CsrA
VLVLSRKVDEEVVIGDNIRLLVVGIYGGRVRLGVTAPPGIPIRRGELGPSPVNLKGPGPPPAGGSEGASRPGPADPLS